MGCKIIAFKVGGNKLANKFNRALPNKLVDYNSSSNEIFLYINTKFFNTKYCIMLAIYMPNFRSQGRAICSK